MLSKYLKQAPTMIVVGVTGFAAWPILFPDGEAAPAKGASKPPESTRPSASIAALGRNPFQTDYPPPAVLASTRPATSGPATTASGSKATALPERSAEDEAAIAGLRLAGTFVDGREQLALIDGKVYARGDSLRSADGSPMPYVLAEVRKDRAVLRRGRRSFHLAFSNTPRPALAKGEGPKAPGKAEAPAKVETAARTEPPHKAKSPAQSRPRDEPGDPRQMILQLLSGVGGPQSGGSTSSATSASGPTAAAGPLGGLASGVSINSTTIAAGIDALMGKLDNIGRDGAAPPATPGNGGTSP